MIIAIGPAKELEKLDEIVDSLQEENYKKSLGVMRLFRVPEASKYNRDRVVNIVNANFATNGVSAYPGAIGDQILAWGLSRDLDTVEKFLDELFAQPNDLEYETFHVSRTTLQAVRALFEQVCPNIEIIPNVEQRSIVVHGNAEQRAQCRAALEAFNKAPESDSALVLATYTWDDVVSYWPVYSELMSHFQPLGAIIAPATDSYSYVVTTTEANQETIAKYLEMRRKDQAERTVQLRAYYLTRVNFAKVVQIVVPLLPAVGVYPGKGANEVFVVASPLNHEKFRMMLSQLESTPEGEEANGISPKIYRVSAQAASTAVAILQPQLPGVAMYPLSGDRLLVWGSVSDHEYVEKALETVAEAFPEPELKRYPLLHLRLVDAIGYCQNRFAGQASFFASTSGDLMVVGPAPVQEQVASLLAEIDVENSGESRYIPIAYDISDIPVASHPYVSQAIASICYDCVQLPTATPGFLVVYARPNDHKKVKEVIDEMIKSRPAATQTMALYSVRRMTLPQLTALLLPLYPNVKLGAGPSANVFIAKNIQQIIH